jgi:hypothetical protein
MQLRLLPLLMMLAPLLLRRPRSAMRRWKPLSTRSALLLPRSPLHLLLHLWPMRRRRM